MTATPLRVLHAHSGNIYGGVERILVTLAQRRDLAPGVAWRFALTEPGRLSDELAAAGGAPQVIGRARASRPWSVWAARAQLQALLRREPCDVAVLHSLWGVTMLAPPLHGAGVPLVLWVHGTPPGPWWQVAATRRFRAIRLIANSHYTVHHLPPPFTGRPCEVVYPPRTPRLGSADARPRLRAELGVAEGAVVLLQVARLEPAKGHRVLLAALEDLPETAVLWIAGRASQAHERAYEASLHAEVRRRGLLRRVVFLGERTDIPDVLLAADVYVQPNTAPEAFGQALVEAMAAGLPAIASDCGAAAEVTSPQTARLVPPGDAHALATAIQGLIADPDARQSMSAAGPAAARALNDPGIVIPRLAAVLRQAAG